MELEYTLVVTNDCKQERRKKRAVKQLLKGSIKRQIAIKAKKAILTPLESMEN